MRIATLLTLPLLGAAIVLPPRVLAQSNVTVAFGTRLGPEIGVSAYSSDRQGEWRANYRRWTPVTLYDVNGHYYRAQVRGARSILVYQYKNEYFLPPQDEAWKGIDKRYNYRQQPTDADYDRARPYVSPPAVDPRLGREIGVVAYSSERAGDWRTHSRRWKPVTLYEVNGRYYPNHVAGTRPVGMYRYRDEYFLPPTDKAWVGSDRRFDNKHQPDDDDHDRVRDRP